MEFIDDQDGMHLVFGGVFGVFLAITSVATAEGIEVFLDIEENTRTATFVSSSKNPHIEIAEESRAENKAGALHKKNEIIKERESYPV